MKNSRDQREPYERTYDEARRDCATQGFGDDHRAGLLAVERAAAQAERERIIPEVVTPGSAVECKISGTRAEFMALLAYRGAATDEQQREDSDREASERITGYMGLVPRTAELARYREQCERTAAKAERERVLAEFAQLATDHAAHDYKTVDVAVVLGLVAKLREEDDRG